MNYNVPESVVRGITNNKPGVVEVFLWKLKQKIEAYMQRKAGASSKVGQVFAANDKMIQRQTDICQLIHALL